MSDMTMEELNDLARLGAPAAKVIMELAMVVALYAPSEATKHFSTAAKGAVAISGAVAAQELIKMMGEGAI